MNPRVTAAAYRTGWATVRAMPGPLASAGFALIADQTFLRGGPAVRRYESNLRRVVGPGMSDRELRRLVHAGSRSYLRYWREVFRLPTMSRRRIIDGMHVENVAALRGAYDAGRGVILALPHMGNWDHAGAWCVHNGMPFTTVAERLEPASLFERFVAFRERLGMEVIPLTGGAKPPYQLLAERLRQGRMLCLLADRDLTATGVEVDFFGEPARVPAGPAALAYDTGAVLLPVTLWFVPGGWGARIHDPVPHAAAADDPAGRRDAVRSMTQTLLRAFEQGIAAHPQDWHMFQRVWVADLDPDRLPPAQGATRIGLPVS